MVVAMMVGGDGRQPCQRFCARGQDTSADPCTKSEHISQACLLRFAFMGAVVTVECA